ncbi:hypothetical protein C8Q75DRAFT_733841 [Abortiporus biennis]|nr:hypothetical protein C8Q75DRAFT_733841 [Abortiporus biennis]
MSQYYMVQLSESSALWNEIEDVMREPQRVFRACLMTPNQYKFLLALLERSPDLYLDEIVEELDVQHRMTLSKAAAECIYLEGLLKVMQPYPGPCSVLIMDNCGLHHVNEVEELCNAQFWAAIAMQATQGWINYAGYM